MKRVLSAMVLVSILAGCGGSGGEGSGGPNRSSQRVWGFRLYRQAPEGATSTESGTKPRTMRRPRGRAGSCGRREGAGEPKLALIGATGVITTIPSMKAAESTRRSACPASCGSGRVDSYVGNGPATLPDP